MRAGQKPESTIEASVLGLERCRPFIDAVGDEVLVIAKDHGVVMANRAFLDHAGLREKDVIGQRCYELTHRAATPCAKRGEHCPLAEVLETGCSVRVTHEHFDAGGGAQYVDIIGSALRDGAGRVVAMIESIRDVTLQKKLEAELRVRNAELEDARRRRDEFTSAICHELRNILNVLALNAAMLERSLVDHPERKRVGLMIAESSRLARLVGDLSDAAAIQTQRFSISKRSCDLNAIISARAEAHQLTAERHTISLEAPAQPIDGDWDAERIGQVIDNLIGNAIKYSPSGGPILIKLIRDANEVRVSVEDRGVGIVAERLPHLFEPYGRAHDQIGGLGLGLFVSRAIIEAHGGRIWVTSEERRGTKLAFSLPL